MTHTMPLNNSIVSVSDANGRIVGAGFIISKQLILTCAHVVIQAGSRPGGMVGIKFHLNNEMREVQISAEAWRSPDHEDIAVLQLEGELPDGVEPVVLGNAEGTDGHLFRTFGYPVVGNTEGLWATGVIKGLVTDSSGKRMIQLASSELAPGLSGGPVLDETLQRVVGMVTCVYYPDRSTKHRDTGFAIPSETLWQISPELGAPYTAITNPFYTTGRIPVPELFFGRERLVREIRSELKKRCSVSVVGESEIGKSSLLYYLYVTRTNWLPDVVVEYIDLQRILDESDFCETVLKKLGEAGDTLRHLKRILENREIILLLDEVERLAEQDFNPRLHDLLRSLAQEPHFAMCTATRRPLEEVFPSTTPGGVSPFHNIFIPKVIGPFTESEARAMLAQCLAGTGVIFTNQEISLLLTESRYHPAQLQKMAKVLFDKKIL